jgi:hypothetical protein
MEIVKLFAVGGSVFGCGYCDAEVDFLFRAGRLGHELEDGILTQVPQLRKTFR